MKKIIKLGILSLSFLLLIGCTNTEPKKEKTTAEKTAFLLDVLVASAIYNETNFGAGKEFINTTSKTNSQSVSTTNFTSEGMVTNTVTTSKTKSRSEGFGFGIGNW